MKTKFPLFSHGRFSRLVFCGGVLAVALAQGAPDAGTQAAAPTSLPAGELRLQFRGARLEQVLDYLSEAAGFIIVPETEIRGTVDVWSKGPVTRNEAIQLLNGALEKHGYALLLNGRTLSVLKREQARTRDVPVRTGNNSVLIPKTDQIVTQIIPVRYLDPTQLLRNLQPLLASPEALTANAEGSALVLTDTQRQVRRMVEIVQALDTARASVSAVKVFPLQYADAKAVASTVKELFQPDQGAAGGGSQSSAGRFVNLMRDAGAWPTEFGDGRGSEGIGNNRGVERSAAARPVAVADERSNSLLVSAPEEQLPMIAHLIKQLDVQVTDITEIRIFHLNNGDAQDTADLLSSFFTDSGDAQNQTGTRRQAASFGPDPGSTSDGPPGNGPPGGRFEPGLPADFGANPGAEARLQSSPQVLAVADPRTRSVVVTAARRLMPRIASLIRDLDASPAMKQKLFVFPVENTDPENIKEIIERLFPNPNAAGQAAASQGNNAAQAGNQLNNRAAGRQNQNAGGGGPQLGTNR
jgi:general secretion pathway protein D